MEAIRSIGLGSFTGPLTPASSQAFHELAKKVALIAVIFFATMTTLVIAISLITKINTHGTNLTTLCQEGQLQPALEREKELKLLTDALVRKENCLLLGDPSVGKTALINRLIQEIAETPNHPLKGKRLIEFDPVSFLENTQWQGQLEMKFQGLLNSMGKNDIMVIDNMFTAMSRGYTNNSSPLVGMFLPALEKKRILCIATSTTQDNKPLQDSYPGLVKQFMTIPIQPLSSDQSRQILLKLKPQYEASYKCTLKEEAIEQAVSLCAHHFPHNPVLDQAIRVIKQACFTASTNDSSSTDLVTSPPIVDTAMIETVVTDLSGVSITKTTNEELEKLALIEKNLKTTILGQDEAVNAVCQVIFRSRFNLNAPDTPRGFILLAGPTGVGKTRLAQELALQSKENFLILNMAEFQEPHSISRLIGSPPGYVNHAEGGQLTEEVRRHPTTIILLDEIEKAHPNIFKILLAIAGQGETSDSAGKKIDFRNTIILMTSNLGANLADLNNMTDMDAIYNTMCENIEVAIEQHFTPEFRNRLSDTVIFNPMARETMTQMIELEITKVNERLKKQSICLSLDEKAKEFLISEGYNIEMGARPLARAVQTHLTDRIVAMMMKKDPLVSNRAENALISLKCSAENNVIVFS